VGRLPAARKLGGTGDEEEDCEAGEAEGNRSIWLCGSLLGQQWLVAASGSDGAGAVAIGYERMLLETTPFRRHKNSIEHCQVAEESRRGVSKRQSCPPT
jgi:hypothetical protein